MFSPIIHIFGIIFIYLLVGGLAVIRMRLFTEMKLKMIIINITIMTLVAIIVVIIYLYKEGGYKID